MNYKIARRNVIRLERAFKFFGLQSLDRKKLNYLKRKYNVRNKKQNDWYKKYLEYLESEEWAQIRIEMLSIHTKCSRCGSKQNLQVHHKTYKNLFNEEPEDLEVLCKSCHKIEHAN